MNITEILNTLQSQSNDIIDLQIQQGVNFINILFANFLYEFFAKAKT